jgi:hypothetical protein
MPLHLLFKELVLSLQVVDLVSQTGDLILHHIDLGLLLIAVYLTLSCKFLDYGVLFLQLELDVVDSLRVFTDFVSLNDPATLLRNGLQLIDLRRLHLLNILHCLILLKQDVNLLLVLLILVLEPSILLLSLEQILIDLFYLGIILDNHCLDLLIVSILNVFGFLDAALLRLSQGLLQLTNKVLSLVKFVLVIQLHPLHDLLQFNGGLWSILLLVLTLVGVLTTSISSVSLSLAL